MADRDDRRASSSPDVAGEDFLFHLYRGSELLQDNRVHDAKVELEQALAHQPSDPKGQALLGVVYFRLGLYPRAIAIYERLIQTHPEAIEPRINLALSYLKTGQPAQARFELEKVVEQSPGHSRAWGYLGLAFQRIGDYERASHAFSTGGHDGMARRLVEMSMNGGAVSLRPEAPARGSPLAVPPPTTRGEVVPDLDDAMELGSQTAQSAGSWVQPGREQVAPPPPRVPSIGGAPITRDFSNATRDYGTGYLTTPPSVPEKPRVEPPRRAIDLARGSLLVFPRAYPIARHDSGLVLIQAAGGFATRLEAVRSLAYPPSGYGTTALVRRARGRVGEELLGGAASPLIEITGKGEIILGPRPQHRLEAILVDEEALYVREDALIGLESRVAYENGRLPVGDGEAVGMVQLRGPGVVVAELPEGARAIEVIEARTTVIRGGSVLGWLGRLVPRALTASEAPAGARGFVAFSGEGMVLVDGR